MELSRSRQNYIIMTVIYNELVDFTYGDSSITRNALELADSLVKEEKGEVSTYMSDIIAYSLQNFGQIKDVYIPFLKNWTFERLPLLTQAILLMTYSHQVLYKEDRSAVINGAVTLAKKYVEDKQAKFINAILNEVIK